MGNSIALLLHLQPKLEVQRMAVMNDLTVLVRQAKLVSRLAIP